MEEKVQKMHPAELNFMFYQIYFWCVCMHAWYFNKFYHHYYETKFLIKEGKDLQGLNMQNKSSLLEVLANIIKLQIRESVQFKSLC